jgi:hypothetical protein
VPSVDEVTEDLNCVCAIFLSLIGLINADDYSESEYCKEFCESLFGDQGNQKKHFLETMVDPRYSDYGPYNLDFDAEGDCLVSLTIYPTKIITDAIF